MTKGTFTFQKSYWIGGGSNISGDIDSFNPEPDLRRFEKMRKIIDHIKGEEHEYIESSIEYFQRRFIEKTLIPKRYYGKAHTK